MESEIGLEYRIGGAFSAQLDSDESDDSERRVTEGLREELKQITSLPLPTFLFQLLGFGFFFAWIWLGLYGGYPCFCSGRTDPVAVAFMLGGFAASIFIIAHNRKARERMPKGGVLAGGVLACIAAFVSVVLASDFNPLDPFVTRQVMRVICLLIGVGTGGIFLGYGVRFSRLVPKETMVAFGGSFAVSFFAFFAVTSFDAPVSMLLFSLFPIVSALCLWNRVAPIAKAEENTEVSGEAKEAKRGSANYARGFIQMVIAFGVFTFAASLSQSFEPQKDFALGLDEGWVGFFILQGIVIWLLVFSRNVGTFKILKVLYQAVIVLMVVRLVLQPLLVEDSVLAAVNVMTYLTMFMVFWLLTAFVAHTKEAQPSKAFALVFGVAAICMGAAWYLGAKLYGYFGHERLYLSIAMGCAVAVFCTFGFSVKHFPYLTRNGRGRRRVESGDEEEYAVGAAGVNAVLPTFDEVIADLVTEYSLTPRETEIFTLLAKGETSEKIASDLVISYHTVRTHIRNLYLKLGVTTRSELLLIVSDRERVMGAERGGRADEEIESV